MTHGYSVRSTVPRQQLGEIVRVFDLGGNTRPFTRCMLCNGELHRVTKDAVADRLPPRARMYFDEFAQCEECAHVYWPGSHYQRMRQMVDELAVAERSSRLQATKVQLRFATLPGPLGLLAAHYWFVMWDADGCCRWEVWQTKNAGGQSIGHVHRDLRPPDAGVGGGPARIAAEWTSAEAAAIKAVLENVSDYRHRECYLAWPGPNSNTFASWVLRRAGIHHRLGWMALGKRYPVA